MAVRIIQIGLEGGPLGMRAKHLKVWIKEATWEKDPGTRQWEKVVIVTKLAFQEGCILTELTWSKMVQIPKGGGEHRWMSLV